MDVVIYWALMVTKAVKYILMKSEADGPNKTRNGLIFVINMVSDARCPFVFCLLLFETQLQRIVWSFWTLEAFIAL